MENLLPLFQTVTNQFVQASYFVPAGLLLHKYAQIYVYLTWLQASPLEPGIKCLAVKPRTSWPHNM